MHFSVAIAAALLSALSASAVNMTVVVGGNNALTFTPTTVTAQVGDIIDFQFVSKNHSVTQSTFTAPCTKKDGGVDSGFQPVAANATAATFPEYSFTVTNASAPIWFYCAQKPHCSEGMVFAVNPTADKNFTAFQSAATATANATTNSTTSSTKGTATGSAAPSASSKAASGAETLRVVASMSLAMVGMAVGLVL